MSLRAESVEANIANEKRPSRPNSENGSLQESHGEPNQLMALGLRKAKYLLPRYEATIAKTANSAWIA